MSTPHASLDAAASDRKARLAKLASLKRKQPGSEQTISETTKQPLSKTGSILSGRNYDVATRGPKLGFETAPESQHETIEQQAERISAATAEKAAKDEEEAEKGIDLFRLQPKKPNWDLKRDLEEKMKVLDVRTQNAIARLVRERIAAAKKEAQTSGKPSEQDAGEEVGVEGSTLVEAVHLREREDEQDRESRDLDDDYGNP